MGVPIGSCAYCKALPISNGRPRSEGISFSIIAIVYLKDTGQHRPSTSTVAMLVMNCDVDTISDDLDKL